jgi:hypothetical protein
MNMQTLCLPLEAALSNSRAVSALRVSLSNSRMSTTASQREIDDTRHYGEYTAIIAFIKGFRLAYGVRVWPIKRGRLEAEELPNQW